MVGLCVLSLEPDSSVCLAGLLSTAVAPAADRVLQVPDRGLIAGAFFAFLRVPDAAWPSLRTDCVPLYLWRCSALLAEPALNTREVPGFLRACAESLAGFALVDFDWDDFDWVGFDDFGGLSFFDWLKPAFNNWSRKDSDMVVQWWQRVLRTC